MNTFVAVVIGLVAYFFFLSGESFLSLLSLVVLVLYLVSTAGSGSGSRNGDDAEAESSERAGGNEKVDRFAERTGDLVNNLGTFFGHLFNWAFKGEKKEKKSTEYEPEFQIKSYGGVSTILKKKD